MVIVHIFPSCLYINEDTLRREDVRSECLFKNEAFFSDPCLLGNYPNSDGIACTYC